LTNIGRVPSRLRLLDIRFPRLDVGEPLFVPHDHHLRADRDRRAGRASGAVAPAGPVPRVDNLADAVCANRPRDLGDGAFRPRFDGVEEALLKVAESYVQLLTPIRDDSPVAKAIEKRGEGLHHIAYRVDDCGQALEAMVAAGATAIDQAPRPGSRGTTVAFIHPKGSFGTLIELVQE